MSRMEPFEIRARPSARSIRTRLIGPAVIAAVGVGLLVAGAVGDVEPDVRSALLVFGFVVGGIGGTMVLQQRRLLWPGVLLRLDTDGIHVRRDAAFVRLAWDRVAGLRLLPVVLREPGRGDRQVGALSWVPVDDRTVPDGLPLAGEQLFPLGPRRARLATLFNGTDRSVELRALLDVVRRRQPHVAVLDAVLDTAALPAQATGDDVLVLASGDGWGLLPQVVEGLRAHGRRTVLLGERDAATAVELDLVARAVGAHVRWVERPDDEAVLTPEVLGVVLSGVSGLVVVTREPGVALPPGPGPSTVAALRIALAGRAAVVVVRDPADVETQVARWDGAATVVAAEVLTETAALGTVTMSRQRPGGAAALATPDLMACVVALLEHPVGGLVHLSGGTTPVAEAVAGCAG